jgi:hypothetical protein
MPANVHAQAVAAHISVRRPYSIFNQRIQLRVTNEQQIAGEREQPATALAHLATATEPLRRSAALNHTIEYPRCGM